MQTNAGNLSTTPGPSIQASPKQEIRQGPDSGLYKYEEISGADTIRVLELIRGMGDVLECSIKQVKFSDGGYHALSYEWGSEDKPHEIYVRDGGKNLGAIPLTKNLLHALKDLRDSPDIKTHRFWIDQISINQNDEEEKGRQVALMANIYRNASQTITYLGPQFSDMEGENGALDLLSQIYGHTKPFILDIAQTYPSLASTNPSLLPLVELMEQFEAESPHWTNLLRIVYSGWIHRLWMIQENLLCPNTVMLRGRRVLDWVSVATIPILFAMNLLHPAFLEKKWRSIGWEFNPSDINYCTVPRWKWRLEIEFTGRGSLWKGKFVLGSFLTVFQQLSCHDPRDRVFAMLGMSEDAEKLGIIPNYQISASHLFRDVSLRIYCCYQQLKLLSNLSSIDNLTDTSIPTWAYRPGRTIEATIPSVTNPHPSKDSDIKFEAGDAVMVVKGRIIDKITFKTPPPPFHQIGSGGNPIFARNETSRQLLRSSAALLQHAGMTLESVHSLFYSWTCGDSLPLIKTDVDIAFTVWCKFMNTAYWLVRDDQELLNEPWYSNEFLPIFKSLCALLSSNGKESYCDAQIDIEDKHRQIARQVDGRLYCRGRSFCITEGGRFCNASGKVCSSDVITLLAGGDKAYLLRAIDHDKYRYIGTVYVHGAMDGEVYDESPPEQSDYEIRLV